MMEELLHELGVYYFWQVAQWDDNDVQDVDERLKAFKGRIRRDLWVFQAQALTRNRKVAEQLARSGDGADERTAVGESGPPAAEKDGAGSVSEPPAALG